MGNNGGSVRMTRRVALLATADVQMRELNADTADADFLAKSGRWVEQYIPIDGLEVGIIVAAIYGFSGANKYMCKRYNNRALCEAAASLPLVRISRQKG